MVKYILVCGGVISYVTLLGVENEDKLIMSSGIGKGVIGKYQPSINEHSQMTKADSSKPPVLVSYSRLPVSKSQPSRLTLT
jgi:hypothetical protein